MSELRKDPVTKRWVVINTCKDINLEKLITTVEDKKGGTCPFCPGNENMTPPEIMAYREKNSEANKDGWNIRVIPNKFPALGSSGELESYGDGVYDCMSGIGAHEVLIETPDHYASFDNYTQEQAEMIFWGYKDRYNDLRKNNLFKYILIFKNFGRSAGASLEHDHSQIIATPVVPKRVIEELESSREHYQYRERCLFCDIIKEEQKIKSRLIYQNDYFIAFSPFAARFAFEVWILPIRHISDFGSIRIDEIKSLSEMVTHVVGKMGKVLKKPPYNWVVHSAPCADNSQHRYYHWHIEIMPRLTKMAGFEWGSGFYNTPVCPELSAEMLRNA